MDYEKASVEEIIAHFDTVSRQRRQQILKKFQDRCDEDTVAKIQQAKKLLKERKHRQKYQYDTNRRRLCMLYRGIMRRIGKRAYKDCSSAWTSESEFVEWARKQVGVDQKGFELDKDILVKGNRVYGPDTCVFVPQAINVLLSGCYRSRKRGKYPLGVTYNKGSKTFVAQMSNRQDKGLDKYLGSFPTVEAAFACYKAAKEARIKTLADKWKDLIDPRAYEALVNRTVEWDD